MSEPGYRDSASPVDELREELAELRKELKQLGSAYDAHRHAVAYVPFVCGCDNGQSRLVLTMSTPGPSISCARCSTPWPAFPTKGAKP